jgi:hypothetical protein
MQTPKGVVFMNFFGKDLTFVLIHAIIGYIQMTKESLVTGFTHFLSELSIMFDTQLIKTQIEEG